MSAEMCVARGEFEPGALVVQAQPALPEDHGAEGGGVYARDPYAPRGLQAYRPVQGGAHPQGLHHVCQRVHDYTDPVARTNG